MTGHGTAEHGEQIAIPDLPENETMPNIQREQVLWHYVSVILITSLKLHSYVHYLHCLILHKKSEHG